MNPDQEFDHPVPFLAGAIVLVFLVLVVLTFNSPTAPALNIELLPVPNPAENPVQP